MNRRVRRWLCGMDRFQTRRRAVGLSRRSSRRTTSCSVCGRRAPESLCDLAGTDDSILKATRVFVEYPAGQVIFSEGQPPFALYCIASGTAKIYKTAASGGQVILRVLGAGQLLGYRAVLANEPYAATAAAITPAKACVITRERFHESLRVSPDLCVRFLAKMARELRLSEEQLLNIASEPVRKRLARLLLLLIQGEGRPIRANSRVPSLCSRSDMAQMIGTAPETISRTLGLMARQKLIRVTRKEIWVVDPVRLNSLAGAGTQLDVNQV
jgi:CRP-like cAMP-binding protein